MNSQQARELLKMQEEERKWQEECRDEEDEFDVIDNYLKYTSDVCFDFKLHFETSDEHELIKQVVQQFYEEIEYRTGANIMPVYEYYNYQQRKRRNQVKLHFLISINLKKGRRPSFIVRDTYLSIRQEIHDLEYNNLKSKLKSFAVTYEYYKNTFFEAGKE